MGVLVFSQDSLSIVYDSTYTKNFSYSHIEHHINDINVIIKGRIDTGQETDTVAVLICLDDLNDEVVKFKNTFLTIDTLYYVEVITDWYRVNHDTALIGLNTKLHFIESVIDSIVLIKYFPEKNQRHNNLKKEAKKIRGFLKQLIPTL